MTTRATAESWRLVKHAEYATMLHPPHRGMTRNNVTMGELIGELVGTEGTEHPRGGWQIGGSGLWRR
ncbi:hypothetical protein QJS04_geneDACA007771 [Acorus gramineus]|uniref:Uncharacterized protein n=1 Tax=Acorus gramineus TaxID=55184 RepID=A0AAV9BCG8_ACOGR|nr:hypothetical protein QJS04_geneDACA007771 [Acorus gramineus]